MIDADPQPETHLTFQHAAGWLFDFERPEVRLRATLAVLGAALISPYFRLPGALQSIRIEQVLIAAFLIPLAWYAARHPEARRIGIPDLIFFALPAAITLSVLLAPFLVPQVGRSYRDLFDVLRGVQYWLIFRLALTCEPTQRTSLAALRVLWAVGIAWGGLVLAQYLGGESFSKAVTSLWATGHDLEGVILDGRVVGTVTNADVFALIAAFVGAAALSALVLRIELARRTWLLVVGGLAGATLGFVLAQSRAATVAAGVAGLVALVAVLRRFSPRRLLVPAALAASFTVLSIGLLFAVPSQYHTVTSRFNVSSVGSDPSVVLRVARLRLLFSTAAKSPDTGGLCNGSSVAAAPPGHNVAARSDPADPAVARRDQQRKHDVAAIAAALNRYFCAFGKWPMGNVGPALASVGLSTIPTDPNGGNYSIEITGRGYTVSSRLEDPADPDGPDYVAASVPNIVADPSFEQPGAIPNNWQTDAGTTAEASAGRFGAKAADVNFSVDGYVNQYVVYPLPNSQAYSASIWLRSATGVQQTVRFYTTEILADGSRLTGSLANPTLPADGSWVRSTLTFTTPKTGLVYIVQLVVQPMPGAAGHVTIDGASLTASPVAPAFALTRDVPPDQLASSIPSLYQSPIIGLGPLKDVAVGGDPGEYILILLKFGIVGLLAYLALFVATGIAAVIAWRRTVGASAALALAMMSAAVMAAIFAATGAVWLNYQVMDVFCPLGGIVVALAWQRSGVPRSSPSREDRPAVDESGHDLDQLALA